MERLVLGLVEELLDPPVIPELDVDPRVVHARPGDPFIPSLAPRLRRPASTRRVATTPRRLRRPIVQVQRERYEVARQASRSHRHRRPERLVDLLDLLSTEVGGKPLRLKPDDVAGRKLGVRIEAPIAAAAVDEAHPLEARTVLASAPALEELAHERLERLSRIVAACVEPRPPPASHPGEHAARGDGSARAATPPWVARRRGRQLGP
ncbi:hypothetical protein WME98_47050 [Sorangium sp. So ce296]|uniref:hypothetical protein n=1 Tax=Sorangium sp. So ce296 TaxID=3133296 RepID=UPI003F5E194F